MSSINRNDVLIVLAFVLISLLCLAGRWESPDGFVFLSSDAANING